MASTDSWKESLHAALLKALKMRVIKDTMALVAGALVAQNVHLRKNVVPPEASRSFPAQPARNEQPPENGKWI